MSKDESYPQLFQERIKHVKSLDRPLIDQKTDYLCVIAAAMMKIDFFELVIGRKPSTYHQNDHNKLIDEFNLNAADPTTAFGFVGQKKDGTTQVMLDSVNFRRIQPYITDVVASLYRYCVNAIVPVINSRDKFVLKEDLQIPVIPMKVEDLNAVLIPGILGEINETKPRTKKEGWLLRTLGIHQKQLDG